MQEQHDNLIDDDAVNAAVKKCRTGSAGTQEICNHYGCGRRRTERNVPGTAM